MSTAILRIVEYDDANLTSFPENFVCQLGVLQLLASKGEVTITHGMVQSNLNFNMRAIF